MNEGEVEQAMCAMLEYINSEANDRAKEVRDKTKEESNEGILL